MPVILIFDCPFQMFPTAYTYRIEFLEPPHANFAISIKLY